MSSIAMEVCPQQKSIWFWFLIFWCDKSNGGNRHRLHRTHLYVVQPSRRNCACSPSRRRSRGPWDHWFIVPEHDDMDLYCVLVYINTYYIILSMMMTMMMMKDLRIIIIVTVSFCFLLPYFTIYYHHYHWSLVLSISVILLIQAVLSIYYFVFCFYILYIMYPVWSIIYTYFDWCCFHYYAFWCWR